MFRRWDRDRLMQSAFNHHQQGTLQMKRNFLIASSIAAVLAGTMMAGAQGMQQQKGGAERGMGAEQGQQGPTHQGPRAGAKEGAKGGQTTTGQGQREEGKTPREKSKPHEERTQGQGQREEGRGEREGGNQQGVQRENQTPKAGAKQQGQAQQSRTEGHGNISAQQRSHLRETVLAHGPKAANINVSIRVGTVIPTAVSVVAVPEDIVEIYPDYRGYFYFVYDDEIIIVDRGHRIVAVIDV